MRHHFRNWIMALPLLIAPVWTHAQATPSDSTRVDTLLFGPSTSDSTLDTLTSVQTVESKDSLEMTAKSNVTDTITSDLGVSGPSSPVSTVDTAQPVGGKVLPALRGSELVFHSLRRKTADIRFFGLKSLNGTEAGGGLGLGIHLLSRLRIGGDFSWTMTPRNQRHKALTVSVTHSRNIGKQWSMSVAGYAGPTFSSRDGDPLVAGLSTKLCRYIPNTLPNEQHGAIGFFVEPCYESAGKLGMRFGFMRAQPH